MIAAFNSPLPDRGHRLRGMAARLATIGLAASCFSSAAKDEKPERPPVSKQLSAEGGAWLLVRLQPAGERKVDPDALARAQAILTGRLELNGIMGITVTPTASDLLYVELRGIDEERVGEAKQVVERPGRLEFRLLHPDSMGPDGYVKVSEGDDKSSKPGFDRMRYLDRTGDGKETAKPGEPKTKPDKWIWVKNSTEMSGQCVAKAWPELQPGASHYNLAVLLHDNFQEKMDEMSRANLHKPLAIVVDSEVFSAPRINTALGARFEVSGNYTERQARDLARVIQHPLENPLVVEQATIVPPKAAKRP
jgi:preprotein translocase subunit SecD